MPTLQNMPIRFCKDENGDPYSPVVYNESLYNNDGTPIGTIATKDYVTEALENC